MFSDPFVQFEAWYSERLASGVSYPEAFSLGTADSGGTVSVRTVLLKEYNAGGFVFFTNYESRKGHQLSQNTKAAMLFYWSESARQIRIEGHVSGIPENESINYFRSRPRESQISAWASSQSKVIPGRSFLEKRYSDYEEKFRGKEIPKPPYWGGYRIIPSWFEFWQEGEHRLHHRTIFRLEKGKWITEILAP
ncbi:MAG: pyridoxamine 5'-phosphate oxidase [Bacteroidales bacterium]|nr:pyridoxamine 5'-phosphate oxidase [Bacteroidales bacterium]